MNNTTERYTITAEQPVEVETLRDAGGFPGYYGPGKLDPATIDNNAPVKCTRKLTPGDNAIGGVIKITQVRDCQTGEIMAEIPLPSKKVGDKLSVGGLVIVERTH